MKSVDAVKYCCFVPYGIELRKLFKWYFVGLFNRHRRMIILITPAAGGGGGYHLDIFRARKTIEKVAFLKLVAEPLKRERIIIIDSLTELISLFRFLSKLSRGRPKIADLFSFRKSC